MGRRSLSRPIAMAMSTSRSTPSRPGVGGFRQTEAPRVRHELAAEAWSPDGASLLIAGNDRSETDQDVLIRDLATGETRRVVDYGGMFFPMTWSLDGKSVTVVDFKSNTNMDLYVCRRQRGDEHLTPHEGEIQYLPGPWAVDGSGFYVSAMRGANSRGLHLGPERGMRWIDAPDADVENVVLSSDGATWRGSSTRRGTPRSRCGICARTRMWLCRKSPRA